MADYFGGFLKQSTAASPKIGPFLDKTDQFTPENALTIVQADVRLSKNHGAFAQKNDVTGATVDEKGWYTTPMNTTDTNTLGMLVLSVQDGTDAAPVHVTFIVLAANIFDSLIGATDLLKIDIDQVKGDADRATSLKDALPDQDGSQGVIHSNPLRINSITASAVALADFGYDNGYVYFSSNGSAGTSYPRGTAQSPVSVSADLETIRGNVFATKIMHMQGTIDAAVLGTQVSIEGANKWISKVNFNGGGGHSWQINNCEVFGSFGNGGGAEDSAFTDCWVFDQNVDFGEGALVVRLVYRVLSAITRTLTMYNLAHFVNCEFAVADESGGFIDINCTNLTLESKINGGGGVIRIKNLITAAGILSITGFDGKIIIDPSCTAGKIVIIGGHVDVSGTGGGVTITHLTAAAASKSNSRIKNVSYDNDGNPTHYEEHIYASKADAENDTNATQVLDVTTTYGRDTVNENRFQITGRIIKETTP